MNDGFFHVRGRATFGFVRYRLERARRSLSDAEIAAGFVSEEKEIEFGN